MGWEEPQARRVTAEESYGRQCGQGAGGRGQESRGPQELGAGSGTRAQTLLTTHGLPDLVERLSCPSRPLSSLSSQLQGKGRKMFANLQIWRGESRVKTIASMCSQRSARGPKNCSWWSDNRFICFPRAAPQEVFVNFLKELGTKLLPETQWVAVPQPWN